MPDFFSSVRPLLPVFKNYIAVSTVAVVLVAARDLNLSLLQVPKAMPVEQNSAIITATIRCV